MPAELFKGAVLAESQLCHIVEGNYHFPPNSVDHRINAPASLIAFTDGKGWRAILM